MTQAHARLQAELDAMGLDAALVLKPHDVFYLAGYASVCSGVLLARDQAGYLWACKGD